MITHMRTPRTRAEFEERMNFAREQIIQGQMQFCAGVRTPESLMRVRYLPNGRIDLLSIDETARVHANTAYEFRNMSADLDQDISSSDDCG